MSTAERSMFKNGNLATVDPDHRRSIGMDSMIHHESENRRRLRANLVWHYLLNCATFSLSLYAVLRAPVHGRAGMGP